MVGVAQPVTVDNFLEVASLPKYADCLVELVEGEIVTMPLTNARHGQIVMELGALLRNYVKPRQLGQLTGADAGFVLERNPFGRDTIRGLDIAFISRAKAPEPLPTNFIDFAPDLAVEVLSPGNTVEDMELKISQLLDAGAKLVWIVHPRQKRVDVHTLDGMTRLGLGDTLTGGDVLPGFQVSIADIFAS
ncbi:MAG: Uma2 family endonuclease [Chloroflexi bacterium]|nr:Uma2 family endonuclease [Chloroflexota bacterium]